MQKILNKTEDIAFNLLTAWCFLPVVMSIYMVVLELLGKLPSNEELAETNLAPGYINYSIVLSRYNTLFYAFGVITLIFLLLVSITGLKQLFNKENFKNKTWYYFLLCLLIWSIVCSLKADDVYLAMFEGTYLCNNLCSFFVYGAVFTCASLIKDNKKRIVILKMFAYVIFYCALIMFIEEWSESEAIIRIFSSRKAVVFNQFNHFGYMLCMSIFCFITLYLYEEKNCYLIFVGIMTYALLMNDTFGSYLASVVVMPICYFIYYISGHKINIKKLIPVFIFSFLSLMSIFDLLPYANSLSINIFQFSTDLGKVASNSEDLGSAGTGRMRLWLDTIERIKQRPVFGFGPNGFTNNNAITNYDSPHNEFLQMAGFLGIPGLLMYLGALTTLCISKFKKIKQTPASVLCTGTVLIVYLASSCFGNPVFNTYPYFWLFFGLTSDDLLFDLSDKAIIDELNSKTDKKHLIKIVFACILLCFGLYLSITITTSHKTEVLNEQADLEAMKIAELKVKQLIKDGNIKYESIYYLRISDYTLTDIKPKPYGIGTKIIGNTIDKYKLENNINYNYDETLDYTNKVIKVIAHSSDDIEIEWVD